MTCGQLGLLMVVMIPKFEVTRNKNGKDIEL